MFEARNVAISLAMLPLLDGRIAQRGAGGLP
jgi:hypothetical protein